jgi:exodeoxyribonuclease-5
MLETKPKKGNVVLFDESFAFREHRSRWLYTGITRSAERVTVAAA